VKRAAGRKRKIDVKIRKSRIPSRTILPTFPIPFNPVPSAIWTRSFRAIIYIQGEMLFDAIEKKEKLDVCKFLFFFYDTFYPQIHGRGSKL